MIQWAGLRAAGVPAGMTPCVWLSWAARAEKVDATNAKHLQCSPSAHFHLLRGAHSPAYMPSSPSPD